MVNEKTENELIYYLNGDFALESKLIISPLDRGFLLGDGAFETIKAKNTKPFRLPQHCERLFATADFIGISNLPPFKKIEEVVRELLQRNRLIDAQIRITVSSGIEDNPSPTIFIMTKPLHPYPVHRYEQGARVLLSRYRKYELTPAAQLKTTSYEENLILRREANNFNCIDAIILNHENFVCEGSFSNVFAVIDGRLITPDTGLPILPGVTRQAVIEVCRDNDIEVVEDRFFLEDFLSAEQVFLTSTLMDIMPITSVLEIHHTSMQRHIIGNGFPGGLTFNIMKLLQQKIDLECK